MSDGEFVKSTCTNCGGRIEHPKAAVGMVVACPHCNLKTQLGAAPAPPQPPEPKITLSPRKKISAMRLALMGIPILAVLAGGITWSLMNRPKRSIVEGNPPHPPQRAESKNTSAASAAPLAPKSPDDLRTGPVAIDRSKGSRLIYAVGTITNQSDHPRLGVKVELAIYDDGGKKLNSATDYTQLIEPRREWRFRALVIDSSASRAEIATIKEED